MRRVLALSVVALVLCAAGYVDSRGKGVDGDSKSGEYVSYGSDERSSGQGSPMERLERAIKIKRGSKSALGEFVLSSGRRVALYTADTEDAKGCLIESDAAAGAGAGCLEGGLFAARKVAFSVNTDGGPEQFDELYVIGIVAPNVRSAALRLTDGREVPLRLTSERTFLFESPKSDLIEGVYPHVFRLFGANGKLVESVSFPPAGA